MKGIRTSLTEKSENDRRNAGKQDDGKGQGGLGRYIQQTEKCPKCKAPMMLARGKSGKCYLRCSACKEMTYLTKDMVNEYIAKERVTCPIHHCRIRAGLSRYGIYVRCDQGHFLKLDEI